MNVHVLYVLELKTSQKNFARLSVCLSVCTLGRLCLVQMHNNL